MITLEDAQAGNDHGQEFVDSSGNIWTDSTALEDDERAVVVLDFALLVVKMAVVIGLGVALIVALDMLVTHLTW